MLQAALLALLTAAPPEVRLERGAPDRAARVVVEAWAEVERLARADGLQPPASIRPIAIGLEGSLPAGVAARSRPGFLGLRPGLPSGALERSALRHEAAHLFLFEACPAAQADRLFHEAFAAAATGELAAWSGDDEGYLPMASALEVLARPASLDTPAARRALARLLGESPPRPGRLPASLARRLGACEPGAPWALLLPEELARDAGAVADALVIVSRHTGEVLLREGAATLPMPFGSTLKPFLVAGAAGPPPRLAPNPALAGWRCGDGLPDRMDAATALLRSCNGWFLDWARQDPGAPRLGPWGPVLAALGLSALPADASEAIGVRPSLRLSPLALAHAYRLLAEARPDLLDVLSRSAREGTLSGLPASGALERVALKTGTVLDPRANPRLGWIVGVDRDAVIVMARAGRTPRTFAEAFAEVLPRARAHADAAARIQVFGLVDPGEVRVRCDGAAIVLGPGGPRLLQGVEASLLALARTGALACAGGPWQVRPPGAATPRPYAGIFALDEAPEGPAARLATPRERRARRGSDVVFRTTRLAYAAGVVSAEDAGAAGEVRVALARIADANADHSRHPGRPVCDTTHCQVFLGTARPGQEDRRALGRPLRVDRWLPFARGGQEPWTERRPEAAVQAAIGPGARALGFVAGKVTFLATGTDGAGTWEERRQLPCELLRGPLKLPACPEAAEPLGDAIVFRGRGQGHGEGLDVEWAKRSGLSAEAILERAYDR